MDSLISETSCGTCGLDYETSKVVVGRGSPFARLMLIGEAPGAKENEKGIPFVGRSGKILDQILQNAGIDLDRDIYICNLVKTRPPMNRRPSKAEILINLPWLYQQLKLVDPYVVLLAGSTAVKSLLGINEPMNTIRGTWQNCDGRLAMPLFHPSYLLRNPSRDLGTPFSLTSLDILNAHNKMKSMLQT